MTIGPFPSLHHRNPAVTGSTLRSIDDTGDIGEADEACRIDRRKTVLYLAAFTMVVEILDLAGLITSPKIGALDLPMSVIPALALGVACGDRLAGRSSSSGRAMVYGPWSWSCCRVSRWSSPERDSSICG